MNELWLLGFGHFPYRDTSDGVLRILEECEEVAAFGASPVLSERIASLGASFHDLTHLYGDGLDRDAIYDAVAVEVTQMAVRNRRSAYVTQGHPLLFEEPSRLILEMSDRAKVRCRVLPGVSFVDLVMAEFALCASVGLQVVEATALVRDRVVLDPQLVVLIAQLGAFGRGNATGRVAMVPRDLEPLVDSLLGFYSPDRIVMVADSLPSKAESISTALPLRNLGRIANQLSFGSTLVIIPPPR